MYGPSIPTSVADPLTEVHGLIGEFEEYAAGRSPSEAIADDRRMKHIVELLVSRIGKYPRSAIGFEPELAVTDKHEIVHFGERLASDYDKVRPEHLDHFATKHLPILKQEVEALPHHHG